MSNELQIVHSVASIARDKGGPSYVICALASAQAQDRKNAVHIVFRAEPGTPAIAPSPEVGLHDVGQAWPRNIFAVRAQLKRLWRNGQTVIHDQGVWHSHNYAASGFAAKSNLPYVISTHGMLSPWALAYRASKKRLARKFFQDRLLQKASCLMATSQKELESIRALGFANPVAVIPNGVDADIPVLARSADVSHMTALFLSRIHPVKGLVHAIDAWRALRPANWRLKIVGPNELGHREELQKLVKLYGLEHAISFHEAVSGNDKYQCYYDANLFLLPSYSENFGVAVAEALACKLPVVTTTGTPWQELPSKGCGWWIEVGPKPLIETLKHVFSIAPDELEAMGQRGRQWITQEFQWQTIAAQNIAVYEWILGWRTKPDCVELDTRHRNVFVPRLNLDAAPADISQKVTRVT